VHGNADERLEEDAVTAFGIAADEPHPDDVQPDEPEVVSDAKNMPSKLVFMVSMYWIFFLANRFSQTGFGRRTVPLSTLQNFRQSSQILYKNHDL
jgi:hypothetical protein